MPWLASRLSVGVLHLAAERRCLAEADVVEQDDQHVRRAGFRCCGCARRLCTESCSRGAALLADGTGGNGSTEPSLGVAVVRRGMSRECALPRPAHQERRAQRQSSTSVLHGFNILVRRAAVVIRRAGSNPRHFFRYAIFVVPIVPLKANGAWS